MTFSLQFAAQATRARFAGLREISVSFSSTDSRTIEPGALFFALKGPSHDGHDFVRAAFDRGAAAAVVERETAGAGPLLIVEDTLGALQALASAVRDLWHSPGRRVVAVTGSAGKTTTKDAAAAVLSTARRVGKTSGNLNNHIGVPLSILNLPGEADAAVIEIGMNHAGEIRHLASLVRPDTAIVTNAGSAHLENFDSIDGVALAKRELVEALPAGGVAILNATDARVRDFARIHPGRTILYGDCAEAEIRAVDTVFTCGGCEFTVPGAGRFVCPLPTRGGLLAALAALAAAHSFGMDLASPAIRGAIAGLHAPKMRLQRLEHAGMAIWDDCYNSSPEAARMMLDLLAETPARRRIAVLGEMLELGRWSEELHRGVGVHAAKCNVSVLVGIRGAACHLVDAARGAGLATGAAFFFDDPSEAGVFLKSIARPGDAILFKGSRGTRVEAALAAFLN
jgi:UDP-N-acetylmuramoyl-tripeptide--D-alanyl-D-alanine ligase